MVNTIENLRNALKNDTKISTEVTDALMQLDTTASTATQADLNDMLVEFYERLKNNPTDKVEFETMPGIIITTDVFSNWINNEFTTYSANLFNNTVKENKDKDKKKKVRLDIIFITFIAIASILFIILQRTGETKTTEKSKQESISSEVETASKNETQQETEVSKTKESANTKNKVEEAIEKSQKTEETEEVGYNGTLDTIEFIVDTTEVYRDDETQLTNVTGDTATLDNYSGMITIHVSDAVEDKSGIEIKADKHYVFTVEPMMTRSIPPIVNAVSVREATEVDLEKLENIRSQVSDYAECMERYEDMEEQEILDDYILHIGSWTDKEVEDFFSYLEEHEYSKFTESETEDTEVEEDGAIRKNDESLAPAVGHPEYMLFCLE